VLDGVLSEEPIDVWSTKHLRVPGGHVVVVVIVAVVVVVVMWWWWCWC
jgi:membrane protein DedA with SNARE-associated domain